MKDPSGLPYNEIAKRLGYSSNFVLVMKCKDKEKFDFITSLDPEFEIGYRKYIDIQEQTQLDMQAIYYELEDKHKLYSFSKYLYKLGLYKGPTSWLQANRISLFRVANGKGYVFKSLFLRQKVIKAYEGFKK